MSIVKRNSVCYNGNVDISNTLRGFEPPQQPEPRQPSAKETAESSRESSAERERESSLAQREAALAAQAEELARLKEQYIQQGKEVIVEAKRRAEEIITKAQENAAQIADEAEQKRGELYIKARAEGFEQGKKDGIEACMAEGRGILNEARIFAEKINEEKAELFERYEQEIYDTVMAIANKVTLGSMSVKDGTAAKKLIKKAAKEFRNTGIVRITLDSNGATEEFTADYEYMKELCGGVQHVEIELLPDAEPGTVIVDNGGEITDAGIQTQLRMIQELGGGKFRDDAPKRKPRTKKSEAPPPEEEE